MIFRICVCLSLCIPMSSAWGEEPQANTEKTASSGGDPLCGYKCLYAGLLALDYNPGKYQDFLEKHASTDSQGASIGELEDLAKSYGAHTQAVQTSLKHLVCREDKAERFVCIAHVDGSHFVNIAEIQGPAIWIIDPPIEGQIAEPIFSKRWAGNALLVSREPLIAESALRLPSPWKWLAGSAAIVITLCVIAAFHRKRA